MKLFIFGELNDNNIASLCSSAKLIEQTSFSGYEICSNKQGRSYLKKGNNNVEGWVYDLNDLDCWFIDQWKEPLSLYKKEISDNVYSYFSINEAEENVNNNYANNEELDNFFLKLKNNTSLKMADVHLLIPGSIEEGINNNKEAYIGNMLQKCISDSNEAEYNSDFLKNCERYTLGEIGIIIDDNQVQKATCTIMLHKPTNLGVMDIFVPAIHINAHTVLLNYCCDQLKLEYDNKVITIHELFNTLNIIRMGSKRSLVFSYEKLDETTMINLLANEREPMGKIMGKHFKDIISNNLAQYDTAEVYVSETTMLEVASKVETCLFSRIQNQAIEIFFVEMLLLQDAAVSKMNEKVKAEIDKERNFPFRKNADKILHELLDENAYTLRFTDYKQFYYPTVRVSAENVSKAFGIDEIYKKYEQNKMLLENMIKNHKVEFDKKENKIKNILLSVLTILSGIETIQTAIDLLTNSKYGYYSYYISIAIMSLGLLTVFTVRQLIGSKFNRKNKKERKGKKYND